MIGRVMNYAALNIMTVICTLHCAQSASPEWLSSGSLDVMLQRIISLHRCLNFQLEIVRNFSRGNLLVLDDVDFRDVGIGPGVRPCQ